MQQRNLAKDDSYARSTREFARFVFNGGRPYAELLPPETAKPPAITPAEEAAMDQGLERWVRERWHQLMRESGLDYVRGHLTPEAG